jgi:hypothetical protein
MRAFILVLVALMISFAAPAMAGSGAPPSTVRNEAPFNGPATQLGQTSCATKATNNCMGITSAAATAEASDCVQWNYGISGLMTEYKLSGTFEKCVLPSRAEKVESVGNYRWPICCYAEKADRSCGLSCYLFVSR